MLNLFHVTSTGFYSLDLCRMYQALLASGDSKSAKLMLANIPKDDLHVYVIIEACQKAYNRSKSAKGKNKKNKSKKTQKKEPKVK